MCCCHGYRFKPIRIGSSSNSLKLIITINYCTYNTVTAATTDTHNIVMCTSDLHYVINNVSFCNNNNKLVHLIIYTLIHQHIRG